MAGGCEFRWVERRRDELSLGGVEGRSSVEKKMVFLSLTKSELV